MSKRRRTKTSIFSIILACSLFILLSYAGMNTSSAAGESPAFVRIVHASPDVGTVDVFMGGRKLLSSFQYATVSNYLPLPPGSQEIKIALIGKGIGAPVVTHVLAINTSKAYTIAAVGMQANKSLALQVFEDNNVVSGNTAKLRIYHLSPGTGTVDISEDMHPVIHDIAYTQASDYLSVPAGTYAFNATITPTKATIPLSTELKPWTVTSLFAIGLLNNDPHLKFVTAQTSGTADLPQTGSAPPDYGKQHQTTVWEIVLLIGEIVIITRRVYTRVNEIARRKNK